MRKNKFNFIEEKNLDIKFKFKKVNINEVLFMLICLLSLFIKNELYTFIINFLLMLVIIIKSKASLFSIKSILIFFVIMQIDLYYFFSTGYGMWNKIKIPVYTLEANMGGNIYLLINYIFISFTNILELEKEKITKFYEYKKGKIIANIFAFIAMISIIIAIPRFPYLIEKERFDGLLPGRGWNHICVCLLLFTIPALKNSKFVKFSFIFIISWLLINAERVDAVSLILFLCIYFIVNNRQKLKKISIFKKLFLIIIFSILTCGIILIGDVRSKKDINIINIPIKILQQPTASDIAYIYNATIYESKKINSNTYIAYLDKLKFKDTALRSAEREIIKKHYGPGGMFVLGEPMYNYGHIGIIIFTFIDIVVLSLILISKMKIAYIYYYFILATVFRAQWYGYLYIEKGIIYYIPILYVVYMIWSKFMDKEKDKRKDNLNKGKVALIIGYNVVNFGSSLQTFALNKKLKDLGYNSNIIKYTKNKDFNQFKRIFNIFLLKVKIKEFKKKIYCKINKKLGNKINEKKIIFSKFWKENFTLTREYKGYKDLKKIKNDYDIFVLGSDQVWNPVNYGSNYYTLEFLDEDCKILTYASSFGVSRIKEKYNKKIDNMVRKINHLSVREKAGLNIIKRINNRVANLVLDPTLLLERKDYDELTKDVEIDLKEKYIFCYFLGENTYAREFASKLAKQYNFKIYTAPFGDNIIPIDLHFGDKKFIDIGPKEWINLIKNAEFVVTDSFHGTVFSIIYNKKFYTINRYKNKTKESTNSRLSGILKIVELEDRLNPNISDISEKEIDYTNVNKILEEKRLESLTFLETGMKDLKERI